MPSYVERFELFSPFRFISNFCVEFSWEIAKKTKLLVKINEFKTLIKFFKPMGMSIYQKHKLHFKVRVLQVLSVDALNVALHHLRQNS